MDKKTTTDNIVAVEDFVAAITFIVNSTVVATVSLAKSFPDISMLRFLLEKTSEGGKKGYLMSLTWIVLLGFLLMLRLVTKLKDGRMRTRFVDTILSTLSNELLCIAATRKWRRYEAIWWQSILLRWENKFFIGKFYQWKMVDNKDIKTQINEYHILLKDMKAKNINLPKGFVTRILIEKLLNSWNDYKKQLKHKHG